MLVPLVRVNSRIRQFDLGYDESMPQGMGSVKENPLPLSVAGHADRLEKQVYVLFRVDARDGKSEVSTRGTARILGEGRVDPALEEERSEAKVLAHVVVGDREDRRR
jgi:hypothetical protein